MTALGLESSTGGQTPAQADTPPAQADTPPAQAGTPPAQADTPPARVPGVERAPIPADASTSETPGAETAPEPDADKPAHPGASAGAGAGAGAGRGRTEVRDFARRIRPHAGRGHARNRGRGDRTGAEAGAEAGAETRRETDSALCDPRMAPPSDRRGGAGAFQRDWRASDFKRGTGSLFVPKSELVFVLQSGELVPGLDCDPGAGRISVEFVFGTDGPVIFTAAAGGEFCQMGIGIALEVGRDLEMRPVDWGGVQYPQGTVRITNEGLQYAR